MLPGEGGYKLAGSRTIGRANPTGYKNGAAIGSTPTESAAHPSSERQHATAPDQPRIAPSTLSRQADSI